MNQTITSLFSTARPDSTMEPTATKIESGVPRSYSASPPTVSAMESRKNTINPSRSLPNIAKVTKKQGRKHNSAHYGSAYQGKCTDDLNDSFAPSCCLDISKQFIHKSLKVVWPF